jgi:hypothetical protein
LAGAARPAGKAGPGGLTRAAGHDGCHGWVGKQLTGGAPAPPIAFEAVQGTTPPPT